MVADICFQNSDFNLKAQFLSLATNTVSWLPWSDRLTSFFFEKMSAKYSSLNNHSFFQARTVFHFEIKGRVQLSTIAQWNSHHLWYTAELLYTYFFTTILKKTYTQKLRLNKINNFYCSIQGLFPLFLYVNDNEEMSTSIVYCYTLIPGKTTTLIPGKMTTLIPGKQCMLPWYLHHLCKCKHIF